MKIAYKNEQTLVEACKKGDRSAQFQLYRQYSDAMFNVCYRMVGNREDAEDVLQDTFMSVFKNLKQFRSESTIGAWIKRATVNKCINFLKKRRLLTVPVEERTLKMVDEPTSRDETDLSLSVDTIRRAVMELPDGYRVVFSLYMFEGYDHSEISEITGIEVSTSKSQLNRAKKKLRKLLKENDDEKRQTI